MANTVRDRTEERRDRDNPGEETVPPPLRPAASSSPHMPGSTTEVAEINRALARETAGGKGRPVKGS